MRAVSWRDSSDYYMVIYMTYNWSIPGGADYPTYWISILVGSFVVQDVVWGGGGGGGRGPSAGK